MTEVTWETGWFPALAPSARKIKGLLHMIASSHTLQFYVCLEKRKRLKWTEKEGGREKEVTFRNTKARRDTKPQGTNGLQWRGSLVPGLAHWAFSPTRFISSSFIWLPSHPFSVTVSLLKRNQKTLYTLLLKITCPSHSSWNERQKEIVEGLKRNHLRTVSTEERKHTTVQIWRKNSPLSYTHELTNFSYKYPDSNDLRLCEPYGLSQPCHESSQVTHQQMSMAVFQ